MASAEDPIEALLASFDFRALRGALRGAGRRWRNAQGTPVFPDQAHLRARARALLERLRASAGTACLRDGGFVARHCGRCWTLGYQLEEVMHEEKAAPTT